VAKVSRKSTPTTSEKPGAVVWEAGASFAGSGGLEAAKPLLAEGGTDRATISAKHKQHIEKAQDAADFLEHLLDQHSNPGETTSSPAPNSPASILSEPKSVGRPNWLDFIVEEAKYRIRTRQVIPTERGLARFARDLARWWEDVRTDLNAPEIKAASIEANKDIRKIWKDALPRQSD
jgi:hypothetical protein